MSTSARTSSGSKMPSPAPWRAGHAPLGRQRQHTAGLQDARHLLDRLPRTGKPAEMLDRRRSRVRHVERLVPERRAVMPSMRRNRRWLPCGTRTARNFLGMGNHARIAFGAGARFPLARIQVRRDHRDRTRFASQ